MRIIGFIPGGDIMARITVTKAAYTRRLNSYGEQGFYCACGCGHRFTVGEQAESRIYVRCSRKTKWKWYVPEHWDEKSI